MVLHYDTQHICIYIYIYIYIYNIGMIQFLLALLFFIIRVALISLFNGISTFVGYLMPKLFS